MSISLQPNLLTGDMAEAGGMEDVVQSMDPRLTSPIVIIPMKTLKPLALTDELKSCISVRHVTSIAMLCPLPPSSLLM
jgi:hypothetical protein